MSHIHQKEYLAIPGPTPVPDDILTIAGSQPLGHRSTQFSEYVKDAVEKLKWLGNSTFDPLILTTSGTGAMDAAIANTINRGDKVLSLICGVFGERFASIAKSYGAQVETYEVEPGRAIDPAHLEDLLANDKEKEIKAVTVTHNETSTGVINDLEAISKVVRSHGALLIVDAVTSFGATEVDVDGWQLDVVVAGSQKALMLPPGLAVIFFGKRAWEAYDKCENGRFYLDLGKYRQSQEKNMTPFTPNVNLVMALVRSIELMQEEGKEEVFARHQRLKEMIRDGVKELGLSPFVDGKYASPSVTSINPPDGVSVSELRAELKKQFNISCADGQKHLKGKIFRIGHMGYVYERDMGMIINALKQVLTKLKRGQVSFSS